MGLSEIESITNLTTPCFCCRYCYSCKYWQNIMWTNWILNNKECPAQKYTFNSLLNAIMNSDNIKQEESSGEVSHKPTQ